ncbi:MAG: SDR family NAD(P)-dependent oxidoreductase [Myxococcota bacterium]
MTTKEVCLITGVGPGTGSALVRRFAERYDVAMIARDRDRLAELEQSVANTHAFPLDVTDRAAVSRMADEVRAKLGAPSVVVHNAVGGAFGEVLDVDPDTLQQNFQINAMALLQLIQEFAPAMVDAGRGAILATGNTSAYRGRARFAAFAPTKAAQRILLESAARSLGSKGIHVAFVAIDAVIDVPWARQAFSDQPDEFFALPDDIAGECFHVAHQPRSTWAFDVMIRPDRENW